MPEIPIEHPLTPDPELLMLSDAEFAERMMREMAAVMAVLGAQPHSRAYKRACQVVAAAAHRLSATPSNDAAEVINLGPLLREAAQVRQASVTFDIDDALTVFRLEGMDAGVQVLGPRRVICWIGDVSEALSQGPILWHRPKPVRPVIFHECDGENPLQEAADWLLKMRDDAKSSRTQGGN